MKVGKRKRESEEGLACQCHQDYNRKRQVHIWNVKSGNPWHYLYIREDDGGYA